MLSTFPPTECGIATFSAALAAGLVANGATVDVVRCGDTPQLEDAMVLAALATGPASGRASPIDVLNRSDVVIVQHEYGIYGGLDGSDILDVIDRIVVPTIVVAHTVLASPTVNQKLVLEKVCATADAVVVMTETARSRLAAGFDVDVSKVVVVAHGAATPSATSTPQETGASTRAPRLLTWGLLGPGKGIEWAIDALALLGDLDPFPEYVIAGATHPKVVARSGESYREMLRERAAKSTVGAHVSFDDAYRDLASLTDLIRSVDLVVLPYDSTEQVTSGVLVDAVAAGRPVVSTAFPHAVELLSSGAGIVVPQRDPVALADAIRSVLADPGRAVAMAAEACRLAPELSWTAVAGRYGQIAKRLVAERAAWSL
jgi:glycosyltransferase involved in cell wall biosynthesis